MTTTPPVPAKPAWYAGILAFLVKPVTVPAYWFAIVGASAAILAKLV